VQARAGDLQAARTQVERVLSSAPLDEETLELRAALDAAGGHLETALRGLDEASRQVPRAQLLAELRSELQAAGDDRKKIDAAVSRTLARELGPSPASAARVRAEAWLSSTDPGVVTREHWPGRLAQIRQALEGRLRQQDWAGAQAIVTSARLKYPGTAFAAFLGGILELARGRPQEARNQLLAALRASPRSPVVLAALAKTWSREKGAMYAGDQLMRLADADPGFALARYLAAARLSRWPGARTGGSSAPARAGDSIQARPRPTGTWRASTSRWIALPTPQRPAGGATSSSLGPRRCS
jgi:tetratricopeptide (TPR) repeat protein